MIRPNVVPQTTRPEASQAAPPAVTGINSASMTATSYYSKSLNVVLEIARGQTSVDDILALKAIPVREGNINPETRILAFVEDDHPINPADLQTFASRLVAELPEYTGTRTAVVTRHIGPTTRVIKLAKDVADKQSIGVFCTLQKALSFLRLTRQELFLEFSDVRRTLLDHDL